MRIDSFLQYIEKVGKESTFFCFQPFIFSPRLEFQAIKFILIDGH